MQTRKLSVAIGMAVAATLITSCESQGSVANNPPPTPTLEATIAATAIPTSTPQPTPTPTSTPRPITTLATAPSPTPSPFPTATFSQGYVTLGKHDAQAEFEFGQKILVQYSVPQTGLIAGLAFDYTAPNGSRTSFRERTNAHETTQTLDLMARLGTLEPGQHRVEARLNGTIASIMFKVKEMPSRAKPVYSQNEWKHFQEVAFGYDDPQFSRLGQFVRKWSRQNPPVIYIQGSATNPTIKPTAQSIKNIQGLVEEARKLTGLDIKFASSPEGANVSLYMDVPHADFEKIFASVDHKTFATSGGYTFTTTDRFGYLTRAVSAVSRDNVTTGTLENRRDLDSIQAHEWLHALGLTNHALTFTLSMMNQSTPERATGMLPVDRKALELLYRPEIMPGYSPFQARNAIEIIN